MATTARSDALLVAVALIHLSPEHIASWLGHKVVAWETVAYGLEAALLWAIVGRTASAPVAALAVWAMCESLLRAGCRLMHPMDAPLRLSPGSFACDSAGFPVSGLSLAAACVVLVVYILKR